MLRDVSTGCDNSLLWEGHGVLQGAVPFRSNDAAGRNVLNRPEHEHTVSIACSGARVSGNYVDRQTDRHIKTYLIRNFAIIPILVSTYVHRRKKT
jgi:hypothetical protein